MSPPHSEAQDNEMVPLPIPLLQPNTHSITQPQDEDDHAEIGKKQMH